MSSCKNALQDAEKKMKIGNFSEASEILSNFVKLYPNTGKAFYYLGVCKMADNDYEKALYYFDLAYKVGFWNSIIEKNEKKCREKITEQGAN